MKIPGTPIHFYLKNDPNNPKNQEVQNRELRTNLPLAGAPKPPKTIRDFATRPRTVLGVTFALTHPKWEARTETQRNAAAHALATMGNLPNEVEVLQDTQWVPRNMTQPAAPANVTPQATPSNMATPAAPVLVDLSAQGSDAKIPRKVQLDGTRQEHNLQAAQQRLTALFGNKLRESDVKEATQLIDHDLALHGDAVPDDVRSFMITMLAHMNSVDRALPHGRDNVLVRRDTGEIDYARTFEKRRLGGLGPPAFLAIDDPDDPPLQVSAKVAAAGLLLGAGSCMPYAHTYALKLALVVNQSPELNGRVEITLHEDPHVRAGDGAVSKQPVDHVYGSVRFTDSIGTKHAITFDPWADKNRVMLSKHSAFVQSTDQDGGYLKQVSGDTFALMNQHMKAAAAVLSEVGNDTSAAAQSAQFEAAVTSHTSPPGKQFTLADALLGLVDAPVNNAVPGLDGGLVRRRTLRAAKESPLLKDEGFVPDEAAKSAGGSGSHT